ncbi:MAG TPA: alpha/beta fold hydrolase [Vicinamibacterales bacterium]|jgi:pimeloyl-ACP methyl ester carboxylesterase
MSTMLNRRQLLQSVAAIAPVALSARPRAQAPPASTALTPLDAALLPRGVRARFVDNVNGIRRHVLEAGYESSGGAGTARALVILTHGYPELAYSWRKVMPPLAAAGYHVIAPDLRGYGRSGGTEVKFDDPLTPWRTLNEVTDMVALVSAFGYRSVAAIIGHDFGSPVSAWCSVVRPDIFKATVLMSAPFGGTTEMPFNTVDKPASPAAAGPRGDSIYDDLAKLSPPRKHYQRYYATREANDDMWHAPQGVHAFLRAYYHMKSADWKQNRPYRLTARSAEEWGKMPRYYIMDRDQNMAQTVAKEMPSAAEIAANKWLTEAELRVYSGEYGRTGFQGGLQGYRTGQSGLFNADLQAFAGKTIDQPSMFIAGRSDWGAYQAPGALERMQQTACTHMTAVHFVDGAGHWVQQEQPEKVSALLVEFLERHAPKPRSGD